jgi:hypothetical protein
MLPWPQFRYTEVQMKTGLAAVQSEVQTEADLDAAQICILRFRWRLADCSSNTLRFRQSPAWLPFRYIEVETGFRYIEVETGFRYIEVETGFRYIEVETGFRNIEVETGFRYIEVETGFRYIEAETGFRYIEVETGFRYILRLRQCSYTRILRIRWMLASQ